VRGIPWWGIVARGEPSARDAGTRRHRSSRAKIAQDLERSTTESRSTILPSRRGDQVRASAFHLAQASHGRRRALRYPDASGQLIVTTVAEKSTSD